MCFVTQLHSTYSPTQRCAENVETARCAYWQVTWHGTCAATLNRDDDRGSKTDSSFKIDEGGHTLGDMCINLNVKRSKVKVIRSCIL